MEPLLRRVQTRLSIHAHRAVRGLIEGEYRSVFHGRSMDFDDLRPYVAGDELNGIDPFTAKVTVRDEKNEVVMKGVLSFRAN